MSNISGTRVKICLALRQAIKANKSDQMIPPTEPCDKIALINYRTQQAGRAENSPSIHRRVFVLVAALSLALCVQSAVLWHERGYAFAWERNDHFPWPKLTLPVNSRSTTKVAVLNCGIVRFVTWEGCFGSGCSIQIPGGVATGLCAVPPLLWIRRRKRARAPSDNR